MRRWILIGTGAAVVVLVVVVAVVFATRGGGNGPGDQFERAAKAFHDQYGPGSQQLTKDLQQASGGFTDAKYIAAQQDSRKLGDAFDTYGKAVKAIQFPDKAKSAAGDLGKATDAGKLVFVNAAGFFDKNQMQSTLDQYRPEVESALDKAEKALRAALK